MWQQIKYFVSKLKSTTWRLANTFRTTGLECLIVYGLVCTFWLCIVFCFRCEKLLFFLPDTSQIYFPAFFMNNARTTTTPATPTLPQVRNA